jgi:hypothetical protein
MTDDRDAHHLHEMTLSEPELSLTADGLFTFTVQADDLPPISTEKQALLILSVMPRILREMKSKIESNLSFHVDANTFLAQSEDEESH